MRARYVEAWGCLTTAQMARMFLETTILGYTKTRLGMRRVVERFEYADPVKVASIGECHRGVLPTTTTRGHSDHTAHTDPRVASAKMPATRYPLLGEARFPLGANGDAGELGCGIPGSLGTWLSGT